MIGSVTNKTFALRLGLRQIDGLREEDVKRIVSVRDGIAAEFEPHLFAPQPAPDTFPLPREGGGRR